jgi:transcriptional regulator with XRE-family HTH domain
MAEPTEWTFLKHSRIKAGYTKLGLARALGNAVSHIWYLEAGYRSPSPAMFNKLADVLQVDIDELIRTAPKPPPQTSARTAVSA